MRKAQLFSKLTIWALLIVLLFLSCDFAFYNTYAGWKLQKNIYKFADSFSGCQHKKGDLSPSGWLENKLSTDTKTFTPFRIVVGNSLYDSSNIKYVRRIYDYLTIKKDNYTAKDIECWANYGDPIAIMWLSSSELLGRSIDMKIINNSASKVDFERSTKLLDKITNNFSLNIFLNSNHGNVCNSSLAKNIISCRRNFPEAYFVKASYSCIYLRDAKKALNLIKQANSHGDLQAKWFVDNWYTDGISDSCNKGEKLIWVD